MSPANSSRPSGRLHCRRRCRSTCRTKAPDRSSAKKGPSEEGQPSSHYGGALPTDSTSSAAVPFGQRSHRHLGDSCGGIFSACRNRGCRVVPAHYREYHLDRKSTRLNSSHQIISYAVFCL